MSLCRTRHRIQPKQILSTKREEGCAFLGMDPNRDLWLRYRGPIWTAGGIPDTGMVCARIFRGIALFCLQKYSMKTMVIGQRIDI